VAHYQQLKFVELAKEQFHDFFSGKKVIEIGSWDVNGSVRSHFNHCDYVGVDIAEGKGVDLVCPGQDVTLPDASFDVAISCECFEHNPFWVETFNNMCRMLKPGGLCLMSCATLGRREHGTARTTPGDSLTTRFALPNYYLNLTDGDFRNRVNLDEVFIRYEFFYNPYSKDLYFAGIKRGSGSVIVIQDLDRAFTALRAALANVTTERGVSKSKALRVKFKWLLKRSLIPVLGDQRYRNLQFALDSLTFKNKHNDPV
jgi:SAM-dependent methyltransferase